MRYRINIAVALLILGVTATIVSAQSKPSFDGTWKMNPSKSKVGEGLQAITIKLELSGADIKEELTLVTARGERKGNLKYSTDGKEVANTFGGFGLNGTARWEGDALVIEWKEGDFKLARKFTVSQDGKEMTILVNEIGPQGARQDTVVLERQ